jgi:Rrf2 family transcriptional regulator, iron-sulfur cluster assembly transcription factor
MIDLAQHNNNEYTALKDISERQNISVKYLEQITALLSKFGLLRSVRGPQGGYKLAKRTDQYTVGQILRITEGNLAPVACLEQTPNQCQRQESCPTLSLWKGLSEVIDNYLDKITLADLVNKVNGQESFDYVI